MLSLVDKSGAERPWNYFSGKVSRHPMNSAETAPVCVKLCTERHDIDERPPNGLKWHFLAERLFGSHFAAIWSGGVFLMIFDIFRGHFHEVVAF